MNYTGVKPTSYRGILFRSRLEARWAVFFDALDIGWEYEPETFELDDGHQYTPDFRINATTGVHHARLWEYREQPPDLRVFVEVKPTREAVFAVEAKLASAIEGQGPCGAGLLLLGTVPCWRNGRPMHPLLQWDKGIRLMRATWADSFRAPIEATDLGIDGSYSADIQLPAALTLEDRWWGEPTPARIAAAYDAARNERFGLGTAASRA